MGSIALTAVLPGHPSSVDDAREISAFTVSQVTAMRVAPAGDAENTLTYVEEIPITVGLRWCIVPYGKQQYHRWWRLEVKVREDASAIQSQHTLSIAMFPESSTWVQRVPFRPANKKGQDVFSTFDSPAALLKRIEEELRYDVWETGKYLTAGISAPDLPFTLEDSRNRHDATWVFGVCANAHTDVALYNSHEVQQWLQQTQQGTFSFRRFAGKEQYVTLPVRSDEMRTEASSLMWLAIRQALAGPGPAEPGSEWIGTQVTKKVKHLYENHLTLLDQRLRGQRADWSWTEHVVKHYGPTMREPGEDIDRQRGL